MINTPNPKDIVEAMLKNDHFSKWLKVDLIEISIGKCKLGLTVTQLMLNGFNIAHGGISYSLADSCLAFAANSYGFKCVSIETSIEHKIKVTQNEYLIAEAKEIKRDKKIARYDVHVTNIENQLVAYFKGTVHISTKKWELQ